jgi:hypothetical protein
LSAGALSGNETLAQRRPGVSEKVTKNMAVLDGALKSIGASSPVMALWSDVLQRWTAVEQGVASKALKPAESTKLHTQLIGNVLILNEELLSEFGLSLDPEADGYFLIQASLVNMPFWGKTWASCGRREPDF